MFSKFNLDVFINVNIPLNIALIRCASRISMGVGAWMAKGVLSH